MSKKNLNKANQVMKEQKEFEEEVIQLDRVTRVVKGGRRLRFRATVAIGDKKGRVGIGIGKASEVVIGIQKAVAKAKKNLIHVSITKGDTIPHMVNVKYKAAQIFIMPASKGTGVIAGGALRKILHLAGVKNVLSKSLGARNGLVSAQASIMALKSLRPLRPNQSKKFEDEKVEPNQQREERAHKGKPAKAVEKAVAPVAPVVEAEVAEVKEKTDTEV
jgi:small subunit ribosomal protein S5